MALKGNWVSRWHFVPMKTCCRVSDSCSGDTGCLKASVNEEKWEHLPELLHEKVEAKEAAGQGYPSRARRTRLGSGLLWRVLHRSFACGHYKARKKLTWVLTQAAPQNPRSVVRLQVNRRNKTKRSHWHGLSWSLVAWSSLFTSSDENCYSMFLCCDAFNHVLAVSRHSGVLVSAWRWIA